MEPNQINLVTEGTKMEGTLEFDQYTRFEGELKGTLKGTSGTTIIIGQNGLIEGRVEGDYLTIDGYVRGQINAKEKVMISSTGRVIGDISSPRIEIQYGGYFDGSCSMPLTDPSEEDTSQNPTQ